MRVVAVISFRSALSRTCRLFIVFLRGRINGITNGTVDPAFADFIYGASQLQNLMGRGVYAGQRKFDIIALGVCE